MWEHQMTVSIGSSSKHVFVVHENENKVDVCRSSTDNVIVTLTRSEVKRMMRLLESKDES